MNIKDYFSLWTDVPAFKAKKAANKALEREEPAAQPEGTLKKRQPILFLGVLLGALAKVVYDQFMSNDSFDWRHLIPAAIGSVVSFPALYSAAGLKRRGDLTFAKWCVAFQHGFFWQAVVEGIGKKM